MGWLFKSGTADATAGFTPESGDFSGGMPTTVSTPSPVSSFGSAAVGGFMGQPQFGGPNPNASGFGSVLGSALSGNRQATVGDLLNWGGQSGVGQDILGGLQGALSSAGYPTFNQQHHVIPAAPLPPDKGLVHSILGAYLGWLGGSWGGGGQVA